MIWRLDRAIHKPVRVEDQCRKPFYNSKADPKKAEGLFQSYEGLYGKLVTKIWAGEEAGSAHSYFGLIAFMVSLHFRNAAYENRTKEERITVYLNQEGEFLLQSLGVIVDPQEPSQEHLDMFMQHWRVRVMNAREPHLLTSDNPSHIFAQDGIPRLITLPVTPQCCAVAFDLRSFPNVWSQNLSMSDIGRLNRLQMRSCVDALFSSSALDPQDAATVRNEWKHQPPPPGFIGEEEWRPNYRAIEPFEFLG